MKILVTGGAGFIGSHTAVELVEAGYEPIIADDFSNSDVAMIDRIEQIADQKISWYQVDCCNKAQLEEVFQQHPDLKGVIHFAAFKSVPESVSRPEAYYYNNISSLTNLCQLMNTYKVRQLVFSSSCTVYGTPDTASVDETAPVREASNPYGHTKQLGESILEGVCKFNTDLKVVLLRYFNPIGAHPSALIGELPKGVPNNLVPYITQTAAGWRGQLTIFGTDYNTPDGTCIRDFIHVVDLAKAHVKALEWEQTSRNIETFNIGTGRGFSVKELVDAFVEETGQQLPIKYGERRVGDVPAIFADVKKANSILGWKAERTIKEAMAHAWEWQKKLKN